MVGAGTIGLEIGFQCAAHGYEVVLHDSSAEALNAALPRLGETVRGYAAAGMIDGQGIDAALAMVEVQPDLREAAAGADLVSESVPEDPRLKGEVFARLNGLCPPHTVFTTNTSLLLPSQIAGKTGRPDRFAALHFHTPVAYSNVADVMPHPGTSKQTVELLRAFAVRIGQIPVVLDKEHNGYVFNAMLSAVLREAQTMAAGGVASIEDIDRSWMGVMKTPIGPFGIMDLVGIDTCWKITDYWARKAFWMRGLRRNANFLRGYVDDGLLGRKTGRGFYEYPEPAFERPDFLQGS